MALGAEYFSRMDVFLTKYGNERGVFPWKIEKKKEHPIDFFDPKYNVVLTELTFFLPKMGMTWSDFSWKSEKNDMGKLCF